jgi:hypothetical protein
MRYMTRRSRSSSASLAGAAALALAAMITPAHAQVDTLQTVVNNANALGGVTNPGSLGTFGYDPVHDRMYVAGFSAADQQLRRIDNVSAGSAGQTLQTQVFASEWLLYNRGGDPNKAGGTPTPSSLLLNPTTISLSGGGTIAPYSTAWIADGAGIVSTGSGSTLVQYPAVTQKLYQYNLGVAGGNANNVFTSQMTLAQYQVAAGTTNTSSIIGRQMAYSGDGQSLYWIESSTAFGGLWTMPAVGGTPVRLLNTSADINTEPAVTSSGGVDTIYFRGGASTSNLGGIDKVTYDGTTVGARQVAVSAASINSFLELGVGSTVTSFSMTTDAGGNLYFNDTSNKGGIYCVDPQGRMFKVVSKAERQAFFATGTQNVNGNTLRMQPRTVSYTNGTATFNVTQVMYAESSPINAIAGAYVFTPGDFNRDGTIDQTDIGLFKNHLTVKAGPALAVADARYDLNGNGICSYRDVKTLQQFYSFYDGDNIDKYVDLSDFKFLAANFNKTGAKWTDGDFNGDEVVDLTDFTFLASNFNKTASADASASLGAAVPEPATCTFVALAAAASVLVRRRR